MVIASGCTTSIIQADQPRTISVSGSSEIESAPDQAELWLNIDTKAATAREAKNINSNQVKRVTAAVKAEGVSSDNIETSHFSIGPRYTWNRELEENELEGYTAQHVLKVTVTNIDKAGDVADAAVEAGVNNVQRISFTLSKEAQIEVNNRALTLAAEKAREKANALAETLNVRLGRVYSISESNTNFVAYEAPVARLAMAESADASTSFSPGDVQTRGQVSVSFEIQ